MASNTMATWRRRRRTHKNLGRDRKRRDAKRSTLSAEELFAGLGAPGQPLPGEQ